MNNTDFSKKGFTALAKMYFAGTNLFAELEKHGSEFECSALELLDERLNDIAEALQDKALAAGRTLRAEIDGRELAVTIDGHILTR